ncbi:glycerophosphodiester phosphodiesterase [Ruania alkalisoli]|uniref:Glycerophosphodiester phosphodiesterase n=1 Tax=Ruania alkalisoli TaxID=2779775 RepID=A0A7M1SXU4_9MICO|nr:glycerophosphodiester phosphodiesterase family protein [Ruania alkalisoli]QOR72406.1 glycerophosphodiester phosphodiesterase [Ruania alkalisoli]
MSQPGYPGIVGHRGAAAVSAENTLTAFARGEADGADAIELDVHLTANGELAVIHDATVDRTAVAGRTTGAVSALTWAQLQDVELADGERIPSLAQALAAIGVEIHVEIKAPAAAVPATELVRAAGLFDRVVMTSFDIDALRDVRAVAPDVRVGVISAAPTPQARDAVRELGAASLALQVRQLDDRMVEEVHTEGALVCGWPVLTSDDLRAALAAGVDLVTADDPAWCRAALAALRH